MERPSEYAAGQRWNWAGRMWADTILLEPSSNGSWIGKPFAGGAIKGNFSKEMLDASKFVGWAPGFGPQAPWVGTGAAGTYSNVLRNPPALNAQSIMKSMEDLWAAGHAMQIPSYRLYDSDPKKLVSEYRYGGPSQAQFYGLGVGDIVGKENYVKRPPPAPATPQPEAPPTFACVKHRRVTVDPVGFKCPECIPATMATCKCCGLFMSDRPGTMCDECVRRAEKVHGGPIPASKPLPVNPRHALEMQRNGVALSALGKVPARRTAPEVQAEPWLPSIDEDHWIPDAGR